MNVGVLLFTDRDVLYRFHGQRDEGSIDGRRVKFSSSVRTYKAWVEYWHHVARGAASPADAVATLLERDEDANYFIEFGGWRVLGASDLDAPGLLNRLFNQLVDAESERATPDVKQLSEAAFNRLGISENVKRGETFEIPHASGLTDGLYFDYRYDNGHVNLMQVVSLIFDNERSWDAAHAAAWALDRASTRPLVEGRTQQLVALVKPRPRDKDLARQLGLLREVAEVVDVAEQETAPARLAELLHVPPSLIAGPPGLPPELPERLRLELESGNDPPEPVN